ncbi:MAG TPA: potassium channel family protein [Blastocatellia bacterium]|nr:potassium channel family protein [Blastocatellia bacterium]
MILIGIFGVALIAIVLLEAFEAIVLPRRVTRRFWLTKLFYRFTWEPWAWMARKIVSARRRENYLGVYGPLSLLVLLAIWAAGLVFGFAMLHWSRGSRLNITEGAAGFGDYLYLSGTTFFTLGFGDVVPLDQTGRALAVLEAGMGFAFLALIIGYLPVIYQGFSRREVNISLLDARAGSPPTSTELLRRHRDNMQELERLLRDWERWSADLMESHLSYPVLCYYRSQHNNQSWIAALTAILDTCALVMVGVEGAPARQARLTFAMARHAVVDLSQIFNTEPRPPSPDRLTADDFLRLRAALARCNVKLSDGAEAEQKLAELRAMYEPYVYSLADYLFMPIPRWLPATTKLDNWQTSAWGKASAGTSAQAALEDKDELI